MKPNLFPTIPEPWRIARSIEREAMITVGDIDYLVELDAQVSYCPNDDGDYHNMDKLDRLWPVTATDPGGHTVLDSELSNKIQTASVEWCKEHLEELVEQAQKERNK